jgi:hypothetical protein
LLERLVTQLFLSRQTCWRLHSLALTLSSAILFVLSVAAIAQGRRNPDCNRSNGMGCGHDVIHRIDWDTIKNYQQNLVACLVRLGHCNGHALVPGGTAQERTNRKSYPADETQAGELSAARDEIQHLKTQISEMAAAREQANSGARSRDQALKREQEKTDTLTRELAHARKGLDAAKAERSQISDRDPKAPEWAAAREQGAGGERANAAVPHTTAQPFWLAVPPPRTARPKRGSDRGGMPINRACAQSPSAGNKVAGEKRVFGPC